MERIKPCWHMKTIISALVDNKVTGLIKQYATWHIGHCPHCQAALAALRELHSRLLNIGAKPDGGSTELTSDRMSKLEAAWDKVEREAT